MIDNGYNNKSSAGALVIIFIIISLVATAGLTMLVLTGKSLQSVRGGCFVNFGEGGCNVYATQTITQQPDIFGSPLFVVALIAIVFLGIGFLVVTRKKGP